MMGIFVGVLWVVFVLGSLLCCTVILLQEGKGGGLGEAFGGAGQQAFGVKAQGIQRFTGWVAAAVVLSAILIVKLSDRSVVPTTPGAPSPGPTEVGAPAEPGTDAPAGNDGN